MFIFNLTIPLNLTICTKNLILAIATKYSPKQFSCQQEHKFYYIFLIGQQLEVEWKHLPQHAWHIVGVLCKKHTATSPAGDGMLLMGKSIQNKGRKKSYCAHTPTAADASAIVATPWYMSQGCMSTGPFMLSTLTNTDTDWLVTCTRHTRIYPSFNRFTVRSIWATCITEILLFWTNTYQHP
jgi:hypothetical protein